MAAPAPSLPALLAALRQAGFTVGVAETLRLRAVVQQQALRCETPDAAGRLKSILAAVLVKSADQRQLLDRTVALFLTRHVFESPQPRPALPPGETAQKSTRPSSFPRRFFWFLLVLFSVLGITLSLVYFDGLKSLVSVFEPTNQPPPVPDIPPLARSSSLPDSGPNPGAGQSRGPSPPDPGPLPPDAPMDPALAWPGWLPAGAGLAALGVLLWMGWLWRRRKWRRDDSPPPSLEPGGPPRILGQPPPAGPALLDEADQEALVWGIGRFVTEEPTRRLNIPATVRATARAAGIPHLRFQAQSYQREVWLWVDGSAQSPAVERLARELTETLTAHGLPVERADFWGAPERLADPETRAVFGPRELEERKDYALVAVLTDGRLMARRQEADDRRAAQAGLLRGLAGWPRLWFVDFSRGKSGLGPILAPFGLARIPPEEAALRLGGESARLRRDPGRAGAVREWAAACAVSPYPVHQEEALALRAGLGLQVPAWELERLQAEAPGPPGRLQWPDATRAGLLDWLLEAEAHTEAPAPDSLLARAIDFWRGHLDFLERSDPPGRNSRAAAQRRLEQALLDLWDRPASWLRPDGHEVPGAIELLYGLWQGPLKESVAGQLKKLSHRHAPPPEPGALPFIRLPWTLGDRTPEELEKLDAMGFGGGLPLFEKCAPNRLRLAAGMVAGLLLAALARGVVLYFEPPPPCRPQPTRDPASGMEFVRLCPGTFLMGSPGDEEGRDNDETQHRVILTQPFEMGRFEVTNRQYRMVDDAHTIPDGGEDLPAVNVNWEDARAFCLHFGYRLPTEAEWEYAARAGTATRFSFGDDESRLGEFAWHSGNSDNSLHPVGEKQPNPWGLYDMHGNAWEWVADWYGDYAPDDPSRPPLADPQGPATGEYRSLRGGSSWRGPRNLRSANRGRFRPGFRGEIVGFRCVRGSRRLLDS